MCIDVNVTLPTVNKFLLLYSLRTGTLITLIWTLFRTLLCSVALIVFMIPEVFIGGRGAFSYYLLARSETLNRRTAPYIVYLFFVGFLLAQVVLFIYSIFNLKQGVAYKIPELIRQYLVCWFILWLSQLLILFMLYELHGVLIGWYLILLMVICLEFYGFFVVYSYYCQLVDEETCHVKASVESRISCEDKVSK